MCHLNLIPAVEPRDFVYTEFPQDLNLVIFRTECAQDEANSRNDETSRSMDFSTFFQFSPRKTDRSFPRALSGSKYSGML